MLRTLTVAAVFFVLGLSLGAQTPAGQTPPRGQMPDLGRPTKNDDPLPLFDFDAYFPGKWTFEWDVPESPLGPAGRIEGTVVYTKTGDGTYEALTTATGPAGSFAIKETINYQRDQKTASRVVVDSRGYTYTQAATIGGDLGGFYNLFFESTPFTASGKSVRIKHTMRVGSPLAYRVATSVSVDGGPYSNYGNPWFRKQN